MSTPTTWTQQNGNIQVEVPLEPWMLSANIIIEKSLDFTRPGGLLSDEEEPPLGPQTFIPAPPNTFVRDIGTIVGRLSSLTIESVTKFHKEIGEARAAGVQNPAGQLISHSVLEEIKDKLKRDPKETKFKISDFQTMPDISLFLCLKRALSPTSAHEATTRMTKVQRSSSRMDADSVLKSAKIFVTKFKTMVAFLDKALPFKVVKKAFLTQSNTPEGDLLLIYPLMNNCTLVQLSQALIMRLEEIAKCSEMTKASEEEMAQGRRGNLGVSSFSSFQGNNDV